MAVVKRKYVKSGKYSKKGRLASALAVNQESRYEGSIAPTNVRFSDVVLPEGFGEFPGLSQTVSTQTIGYREQRFIVRGGKKVCGTDSYARDLSLKVGPFSLRNVAESAVLQAMALGWVDVEVIEEKVNG